MNEDRELGRTEELLKQFAPRPVNLDRERLMFLAGQAAGDSRLSLRERPALGGAKGNYLRRYLWPASTLAMTTIAGCLAIALAIQISQPPRERIVVREVEVPAKAPRMAEASPPKVRPPSMARAAANVSQSVSESISLALPSSSVLQMRNVALRFGVEALPVAPSTTSLPTAAPSTLGHWQELREAEATDKSPL